MTAVRPETVIELIDAIASIRGFLESREPDAVLSARERRSIERLLDRYQLATRNFDQEMEDLIRAATPRPRR